ncbi:MAG: hypothetical protein HOM41_05745 [Flavobacteriales bacterium]|jgi:hypothetical protein|nr:hypothetical protein [Flavobacteriales bacterium]MBT6174818.1 hypothetical protein [Flavobacteriales bacterium]
MNKIIFSIALISVVFISQAQVVKLAGPRVGATIVTAGSAADFIQNDLMMPGDDGWGNSSTALITQYGWQLESRFIESEDISGLVEWVFLVGGMERGLFLPSVSSLFGLRSKSGFEGALGPNLSLTGVGMVLALGYTFTTGNLNVPINLSFVPGKSKTYEEGGGWDWDDATGTEIYVPASSTDYTTGSRISLTLGFNLAQ